MSKRIKALRLLATVALFSTIFFTLSGELSAAPKVVALKGMNYNVNNSLADNLKALIGKKVSVTVVSGKALTGYVKDVGNHLIHLEKLDGKNFYDALIRIENISAIEAMFRNYQR